MSKPGVDPSSGISLGDALRRPKRHPACRRREAQPGSCTERENLIGDAKGKGASGSNREAESTDAPDRGGLLPNAVDVHYKASLVLMASVHAGKFVNVHAPKVIFEFDMGIGAVGRNLSH